MAERGYPPVNSYDGALKPVYNRFALRFIAAHPLRWLSLAGLKLATLLRADTKAHPLLSAAGLIKLLTSLCTPVWLVLLARSRPLQSIDKLFTLFAVAYVLPFLLTNADPRFTLPLDILLLTHAAILILRRTQPATLSVASIAPLQ